MKQICIILSALFLSSCSYFVNTEQITAAKDGAVTELKNEGAKVVTEIKNEGAEAVEKAKKEIAKITTDQLGQANESIENAIESAKTTIKEEVKKSVEESIGLEIKQIKSRMNKVMLLALVGIVLGAIGVACAIYCFINKITKNYVRSKLNHTIYEDMEFENRIKDIVKDNHRPTNNQMTLTKRDVERIVMEYLSKNGNINAGSSNSSVKPTPLSSSSTNEVKDGNNAQDSTRTVVELFASNSSTMQLSDIQSSFQRGMSVYKLNLTASDSNTAEVTLCVEQADVKQRILVNDSQFLLPICDVKKLTTTPTTVTVKEKGIAMKNADGWNVIRKVFVEIK